MLAQFIARQLRNPSGVFGRHVMTRMLNTGNRELIDSTLEALRLEPNDTLLDIGFGGGYALMRAFELAADLQAFGIDRSPETVLYAHGYCRTRVLEGRLRLLVSDVERLPFRSGLFTKIVTTNTLYFWAAPEIALAAIRGVLAVGGRIALGYSGAQKMQEYPALTQHGFQAYDPERVAELLEAAEFAEVHTDMLHGKRTTGDYVTTAVRTG
ncbi:MAG: class I SAM-dependent methyltransferase [Nannocystaceae bacterium]